MIVSFVQSKRKRSKLFFQTEAELSKGTWNIGLSMLDNSFATRNAGWQSYRRRGDNPCRMDNPVRNRGSYPFVLFDAMYRLGSFLTYPASNPDFVEFYVSDNVALPIKLRFCGSATWCQKNFAKSGFVHGHLPCKFAIYLSFFSPFFCHHMFRNHLIFASHQICGHFSSVFLFQFHVLVSGHQTLPPNLCYRISEDSCRTSSH